MASIDLGINLKFNNQLSAELDKLKAKFGEVNSKLQSGFAKTGQAITAMRAKVNAFAQDFQKNWALMLGKIYLMVQAFKLLEDSAQFKQQQDAFRRLAGSVGANGDEVIAKLREMAGETLSTADTIEIASKAVALGLAPEQLPQLMEIARKSARALGKDVSFMFNSLAEGIGKQQKLILDNTGIVFQAQTAYEEYAKSIGMTTAQLDDALKKQAFLTKTVKEGQIIFESINTEMKTQIETIQSLKASWEDFRIKLGNFLLFSIQGLTLLGNVINIVFFTAFSKIAETLGSLVRSTADFVQKMEDIANVLPLVNLEFGGLIDKLNLAGETQDALAEGFKINVEDLKNTSRELSDLLKQSSEGIAESYVKANEGVEETKKNFDKLKEKAKEVGGQMADSIGSAFADFVVDGKSFGDSMVGIFKNMAKQFISAVASMIIKWLAFMALRKLAGGFFGLSFHDGGQVMHSGGAVRAHNGLAVDEVPIIAQTGEGILSRKGMDALGGTGNLNRLNSGEALAGSSGGANIAITINNPRFNNKEDAREMALIMGEEVDRQLRYQRGF